MSRFSSSDDSTVAGFRFLVVDDHKFSRQIVIEALKSLRVTKFVEAKDGEEAINLLRQTVNRESRLLPSDVVSKKLGLSDARVTASGVIDCVVTDFNMQPKNGLHLVKAIRTGEASCPRDTPILMLTGFSDDFLISASLQLDVNAFLLKPISRNNLYEKITRVMMQPTEVRAAEIYQEIRVPDVGHTGKPLTYVPKPENQTSANDEFVGETMNMPVKSIPEGAYVAEDLIGPTGDTLFYKDTRVTSILQNSLIALQELGWIEETILVKKVN